MAGQQPVEDGRERPYVPAIHALLAGLPQERRGCPRQVRAWWRRAERQDV